MIRRRTLMAAGLLGTALSGSAWAKDDNQTARVYIEHLPCGSMDCSYTPEQQERMRRSEELQRLMTRFASDLYDGSSTQGWGHDYENLDGKIAILERNLGALQQLTATAGRIDEMWASLNGDSRGPASMERLQGFIDSTTQMLEREREVRTVHENSRQLRLSIPSPATASPALAAAGQTSADSPVAAPQGAPASSPGDTYLKRERDEEVRIGTCDFVDTSGFEDRERRLYFYQRETRRGQAYVGSGEWAGPVTRTMNFYRGGGSFIPDWTQPASYQRRCFEMGNQLFRETAREYKARGYNIWFTNEFDHLAEEFGVAD